MSKSTEYSFGTFPHSFHYITFNTFINLEIKTQDTYEHIHNTAQRKATSRAT